MTEQETDKTEDAIDELVDLLVLNKKDRLETLLSKENAETSTTLKAAKESYEQLNYDLAIDAYGKRGIRRFYSAALYNIEESERGKALLENLLQADYSSQKERHKRTWKKPLKRALSYLVYPAKIFSGIYDLALKTIKSHAIAYGLAATGLYESLMFSNAAISTGLYSLTAGASGLTPLQVFDFYLSYEAPYMEIAAIAVPLFSIGVLGGLVFSQRRLFSTKKVDMITIEDDIKKLSSDLDHVIGRYTKFTNDSDAGDLSLSGLDSIYAMATTRGSIESYKDIKRLVKHERELLPSMEKVTGKKISPRSIVHRCPDGVGGVTLVFPTCLMGKLFRKHIYGPVFVNPRRAYVGPSYDFALLHELSHAGGATSEPAANYTAMKAIDDLAERFPMRGYDIYSSANKLCYAVGALGEKMNDRDGFLAKLQGLNVPKSILESFDRKFDPEHSPVPPMDELFGRGSEKYFARLYVGNSYVAGKLLAAKEKRGESDLLRRQKETYPAQAIKE